jgi:hypothetical protein
MVVLRYILRIFSLWTTIAFTALDILLFIVSVSTKTIQTPVWFYWTVAGIGFVVANVQLFKQLEDQLNILESDEATISVKIMSVAIGASMPHYSDSSSSAAFFPTYVGNPNLLSMSDDQGQIFTINDPIVPLINKRLNEEYDLELEVAKLERESQQGGWFPSSEQIVVDVEIENTGTERGELLLHLDKTKSDFDDLFFLSSSFDDKFSNSDPGYFSGFKTFSPQGTFDGNLDGRSRWEGKLGVDLWVNSKFAVDFAEKLRDATRYKVAVKYETRRIGGNSDKSEIFIRGGYVSYRKTVIHTWREKKQQSLIKITESFSIKRLLRLLLTPIR